MKDCLYLKTNSRMCFYISKQINKCQKNEESLEIDIHKIVLIYITYDVSVTPMFSTLALHLSHSWKSSIRHT